MQDKLKNITQGSQKGENTKRESLLRQKNMEYRILALLCIALTAGEKFICFVVRL